MRLAIGPAVSWTRSAAWFVALAILTSPADAKPSSETRYLYYLHGKVVEDFGPRGVNPRFGAYDYPGIVAAFARAGFVVIAPLRGKNTDVSSYAKEMVARIRAQISAGIPPSHITVVGASKGSVIASLISSRLGENELRYVLLANCNDWLVRTWNPHLTGHVLSIYESSDETGHSCQKIVARSPKITQFAEVKLSTGLGHGVVYRPLDVWVKPAVDWAKR